MDNLVLNQDIIRKGDTVFVSSQFKSDRHLNNNEYIVTKTETRYLRFAGGDDLASGLHEFAFFIDQNGNEVEISQLLLVKIL